jgi:hypothetical protein
MKYIGLIAPLMAGIGLAACSSSGGNNGRVASISSQPTLQAICEVKLSDRDRIFESNLGAVTVSASNEIKIMATDEEDAKKQFQAMGYATRERPCAQIRVQRVGG